uniref:Uncharacterized protein n=1 Tax=Parascaris equorum TaxID=6256 RepID=A0A914RPK3_PAREQ
MCGDSELLGTYFTVLIHLCTQSKEARRFARLKVMPPLRAEDVERRPDYCGFGNAAGLLANYGFLGAINQPKRQSDSEDSETEDYKQVENFKLMDQGVISPGTVGEDGRLRPVKHVLELAPKDDPPDEEGSDID